MASIQAQLGSQASPKNGEGVVHESTILNGAKLYQNTPNPASSETTIRYSIPEGTNTASLLIFSMNGQQVGNYPIHQSGIGSTTIEANQLGAGTYSYSLFIDGHVSATQKMVITE